MGKPLQVFAPPPSVFADQPAEMMMGPFTSKLTLGVVEDNGHDVPRPVMTVIMPTAMLIQMARDILKQAAMPSFKRNMAQVLSSTAKAIETGADFYKMPELEDAPTTSKPRRRISKSP